MENFMTRAEKIQKLLIKLENNMRKHNLWSNKTPNPAGLNSKVAFAADYFSFSEWLQWIFIPKTRYLIQQKVELPHNCNILPIAEEAWKGLENITDLLYLIQEIDHSFQEN